MDKKAKRRKYYQLNKDRINKRLREYRRENKERTLKQATESRKRWKKKLKKDVFDYYGGKCVCCGEDKIEFLTIDHINGGGAEHRKRVTGKRVGGIVFYLWLRKNKYPNDPPLQLLCWNCNCSKGYYGYCPHERLDK